MEPAKSIIKNLGGVNEVAKITGVHRTGVWKWMQPKSKGGSDGLIPFKHVPALLTAAARRDLRLTPGDFLPVEKEMAS